MIGFYFCRKARRLSILAAAFFAAGAFIPAGPGAGILGTVEAHAVGFMQALVKSTLIIASSGGGKTVERGGSSTDGETKPASVKTQTSPVRHLEAHDPQSEGKGL